MPKTDQELSEQLHKDGWKKIKEPKGVVSAIFASIPFMLIGIAISYVVTLPFNVFQSIKQSLETGFFITIELLTLCKGLSAIVLYTIAHEMLHGIAIPNFLKSEKTFWGLSLYGGFVYSTEKISKKRFCVISILPLLILSIFLPIIVGLLGHLNGFMMFLVIMNSMGSSVDLLNIALIVLQVPKASKIINNGFETFYKLE